MVTITIWLPDWGFFSGVLAFMAIYIVARIIWRLVPVVGG